VGVKIIAETCQNHNGDFELLKNMVREAAAAGASYIKGQLIFSSNLTYRKRFEDGKVRPNGIRIAIKRPYKPEFERLYTLDLSEEQHEEFARLCRHFEVTPLMTVFTLDRIDFALRLAKGGEQVVKVASPDCASPVLLEELAVAFDHLIVSTGGATDEEIERAANIVRRKGKELTLLHCVSLYPNTLELCNLARMEWLATLADHVGWSDHTAPAKDKLIASKAAILLGAEYVERHFTVLPPDQSKDGPVSISPSQLKELVQFAGYAPDRQDALLRNEFPGWRDTLYGSRHRELSHQERLTMDYFRGRFAAKRADGHPQYNWEL